MKIIVCDPISPKGIALLQQRPEFNVVVLPKPLPEAELLLLVGDATALVVRSETKVTRKVIEAAKELRVVGRAGVGVDNVDIEAATQHGTVVMNTPGGNTVTTAELSFAMLLALARKVPQAHATMVAGKWDRKQFQGVELQGKTLGVLGMGRIGTEVAKRALAFGMRVIAYDPYLTEERASAIGAEFAPEVDHVYREADFITVHMPVTKETREMLNTAAFAKMKPGVRIVNCARGEINRRRWRGRRWMCLRWNRCPRIIRIANSRTSYSRRTWARARRRRRKNAAWRWRRSLPGICSRARCATR